MTAESFAISFRGWANELALLFGGPLYLVGSSLTSWDAAGDRDLRLMLDRQSCETWWGPDFDGPSWQSGPGWFMRKREELKQSRRLTRAGNRYGVFDDRGVRTQEPPVLGRPRFDFQFQCTLFSEADNEPLGHEGKPRLRLDAVPFDYLAAGRGDP